MGARLLILSCSATKRADRGLLPARQRYDGPLWQTLRATDPDGALADCWALSAKFGLLRADEGIPGYDALMTADRAAAMAPNPLCLPWDRVELPRQPEEIGDRWSALAMLNRTEIAGGMWQEACLVGGCHYLPVMRRIVEELQLFGFLAEGAPVEAINAGIGEMRRALRGWLARSPGTEAAA